MSTRVLFVQFTNPAAYPPLEHAALCLLGDGVDVRFVGTEAGGASVLRFPERLERRTERQRWVSGGVRQKLAYVRFLGRVIRACVRDRPAWVYASDALATPAAIVARVLGARVVYHEHDSPAEPHGAWARLVGAARRYVLARADVVVLPNRARLERARGEIGTTAPDHDRWHVVWNCPGRGEVDAIDTDGGRDDTPGRPLRVHFHGSINAARLPRSLVEAVGAMAPAAGLTIVGYEAGEPHLTALLTTDRAGRVRIVPPVPQRADVLRLCAEADVGVALFDTNGPDINQADMAGASNKVFDYLAAGLVVLVNDAPQWRELFQGREHLACFVADTRVETLRVALEGLARAPEVLRQARVDGPDAIRSTWNYEVQFAPVAARLVSSPDLRSR